MQYIHINIVICLYYFIVFLLKQTNLSILLISNLNNIYIVGRGFGKIKLPLPLGHLSLNII